MAHRGSVLVMDRSSPRIEIRVWQIQNQLKQVKTAHQPASAGFLVYEPVVRVLGTGINHWRSHSITSSIRIEIYGFYGLPVKPQLVP